MANNTYAELIAIPVGGSEQIPVYLCTIAEKVALANGSNVETAITKLLEKFDSAGNALSALTAQKLLTARKIGGVSFDGTADITLAMMGAASESHTHTKEQVGLGNVDNTADANKSVKYANTAGSAENVTSTPNASTKAYLTGAASENGTEVTGPQVFDPGVYLDNVAGRLRVESLNIADKAVLYWDETAGGVKMLFL